VGANKWLQPTLRVTLREVAAGGAKSVCIVPVSFVSDHVETLGEIDYEAREQAKELGISQFHMMPGLNDSSRFIHALGDVVLNAIQQSPEDVSFAQLGSTLRSGAAESFSLRPGAIGAD
jgi:ferrochelatase